MAFVLPFCFFYQLSVFCRDVLMRAALFFNPIFNPMVYISAAVSLFLNEYRSPRFFHLLIQYLARIRFQVKIQSDSSGKRWGFCPIHLS